MGAGTIPLRGFNRGRAEETLLRSVLHQESWYIARHRYSAEDRRCRAAWRGRAIKVLHRRAPLFLDPQRSGRPFPNSSSTALYGMILRRHRVMAKMWEPAIEDSSVVLP